MEKILIGFEIIVAIFVVRIQFKFYYSTLNKIKELSDFFPNKTLDENSILTSDTLNGEIQTIKTEKSFTNDFNNTLESINKYLKKNEGAADFAIIKSIVERKIETLENLVISNITLPLYIGLMGTFLGIILGLLKIGFGGGVSEGNINTFIGGVVIAMIASFFGLLLTVLNNSKNYKDSKVICDEGKNKFYNFLQVELLPHLGNSLVDALDRMKNNVNDFNKKFENNIQLFDNKFSTNITSLRSSVEILSENISAVVDNSQTQKEFLIELRKIGYNRMAEANMKVFSLLKETGPTFIKFIEKQKELNASMEQAVEFSKTVENILNRIKTFEESINSLGENISTKNYLGSEILKRIDSNLNHLDNSFDLLKRFEDSTSIEIENYFKDKYNEIQILTNNIKKEVESAFDINIENNPLQKLNLLESINSNMNEIVADVDNKNNLQKLVNEIIATKIDVLEIKKILANNLSNIHIEQQLDQKKSPLVKEKKTLINRFKNIFKSTNGS